jgi:hypothetical protein
LSRPGDFTLKGTQLHAQVEDRRNSRIRKDYKIVFCERQGFLISFFCDDGLLNQTEKPSRM